MLLFKKMSFALNAAAITLVMVFALGLIIIKLPSERSYFYKYEAMRLLQRDMHRAENEAQRQTIGQNIITQSLGGIRLHPYDRDLWIILSASLAVETELKHGLPAPLQSFSAEDKARLIAGKLNTAQAANAYKQIDLLRDVMGGASNNVSAGEVPSP